MPTWPQCGHRTPDIIRYLSGSGLSAGEGASASGIGISQAKQLTAKYHDGASIGESERDGIQAGVVREASAPVASSTISVVISS